MMSSSGCCERTTPMEVDFNLVFGTHDNHSVMLKVRLDNCFHLSAEEDEFAEEFSESGRDSYFLCLCQMERLHRSSKPINISTAFLTKLEHFSARTFDFRALSLSSASVRSYPMSTLQNGLPHASSNWS